VWVFYYRMPHIYTVETEEENIALTKLGATIRAAREKNSKFSQSKLAIEIGLSENQIGRIERGESNPTFRTLYKIAKVLDLNIIDFLK